MGAQLQAFPPVDAIAATRFHDAERSPMSRFAQAAVRIARALRPLALLLALMPVWAGMVSVEAPLVPILVIDEAAFPMVGSSESTLVMASSAVTVNYRLDAHESLLLEAVNLPAAVQRLEWHLRDHRVCGARHAFVEVAVSGSLGIVTFPELVDNCVVGGIAVADAVVLVCQGTACQGGAVASYRPPLFADEETVGYGVFEATYALMVDVTAGASFAGPVTMRYSVGLGMP
jgi:hypothetical protein